MFIFKCRYWDKVQSMMWRLMNMEKLMEWELAVENPSQRHFVCDLGMEIAIDHGVVWNQLTNYEERLVSAIHKVFLLLFSYKIPGQC
jgi:hypothetical protein